MTEKNENTPNTARFTSKSAESFNFWRRVFQYITCSLAVKNYVSHVLRRYNFKVEGLENFDKKKKYIVASNHLTGLDPFIIPAMLHLTIAFMAKKQLFETFWSSVLMDWCGAFAVDRDKTAVSTIKTALAVKKTSWNLGLFPQGTRSNNGRIEKISKGFASIAKKMETDVLPVGIVIKENTNSKKKDFIIKAGKPITYKKSIDDIIQSWAASVSKLAELEYTAS